ncbi:MAG: PQQ-like beta-propeller repeat protein [Verrucomicrobia bacterium]|nr:PQQ-like beta-propeller repeat protein [Verrucomicrobiota bacterium]
MSENCAGSCGEGFWLWPRRRGPSIPNAGCKDRANAGHGQKTRRPEGFRAKGRLASLLLSRRSREDILLRCASPSGLWRENRTPRNFRTRSYVPTPLFYEGRVYLVKNGGLVSCFDAKTGQAAYQEESLGALGDYYASPVAANGKICVASQPGVVVIYRAGESLEVLARNNFGEPILATPAIVEDTLYVRTENHFYAFAHVAGEHGKRE